MNEGTLPGRAPRKSAHLERVRRASDCGWNREGLRDFLNFSVANAGCADAHPAAGAVHQRAHRLQIEVPAPLRNVMGVTDLVAEQRLPAAYITNLCH